MKKVLVINAHPDKLSFNYALSEAYTSGLNKSEISVEVINLIDLEFNPILKYGYRKRTEMEPDLVSALEKIKQADHLVWFFPMWWYSVPAILKGFIDRVFLPGIAFEYVEGKPLPKKLFKGKTAHIFITADTPRWYDWLFMGSPSINQFKKGTLQFCGVTPVKVTYISTIKNSSETFRNKWLNKVFIMAQNQR
jgi:NAD(P)H dehydrogenase (quinone)